MARAVASLLHGKVLLVLIGAIAAVTGRSIDATAAEFRLATFSADVTIPLGHRCMGILPMKATQIDDPLDAHGFVLLGAERPIVLVALDWCELRNGAYDRWRDVLADAAGTTRERVLVSCLHQHDAPVVDTDALVAALESGEILAAGLDVTDPEPLPADHALVSMPNCVVLPHIGSATLQSREAMATMAARNLVAVLEGRQPEAIVNPEVLRS